jgi:sporadic carbohydrate cluster 2OG-Fe(II) oxygenase
MLTKTRAAKTAHRSQPRPGFFSEDEHAFIEGFLRDGYAIIPLEQKDRLDEVRRRVYELGCEHLGLKGSKRPSLEEFLDHTERFAGVESLNALRLAVINGLNSDAQLMRGFFDMARRPIEWTVGNEIAMQRTINLSIQLPNDDSSLLPLHSDVWDGNSPYEIVLWLPLVDCFKTKSMYVLPRAQSRKRIAEMRGLKGFDAEKLFQRIKPELVWLEVPYGSAVLFTHCLMHGNRINEEKTTRWTFNIRLKGLLTPYGAKELGESFLPVTTRPATRIGFEYLQEEKS